MRQPFLAGIVAVLAVSTLAAVIYLDGRMDEIEQRQLEMARGSLNVVTVLGSHETSIATINETIDTLNRTNMVTMQIMRVLANNAKH